MIWYDIDINIDMIYINIYIEIYKTIEMARRKIGMKWMKLIELKRSFYSIENMISYY